MPYAKLHLNGIKDKKKIKKFSSRQKPNGPKGLNKGTQIK